MQRFVEKLGALGHLSRLQIFRSLVRAAPEGRCVEEIRERVPMAAPTLSHHLDVLRRSGLIAATRQGRFIYYAVNWTETSSLLRFLTKDCCADLHRTRFRRDRRNTVRQRSNAKARNTKGPRR